jgi:hypothetical protein
MGKEKGNNFFKLNEEEILLWDIRNFNNFNQIDKNLYFGGNVFNRISKNKTCINNKLNEALGPNLASFYIIKKKSEESEERKLKLMNELEQLEMNLNELDNNMHLDRNNRANQRKAIIHLIKQKNKEMGTRRAVDFPYVIELFTRKDWKDYFDKKGLK